MLITRTARVNKLLHRLTLAFKHADSGVAVSERQHWLHNQASNAPHSILGAGIRSMRITIVRKILALAARRPLAAAEAEEAVDR